MSKQNEKKVRQDGKQVFATPQQAETAAKKAARKSKKEHDLFAKGVKILIFEKIGQKGVIEVHEFKYLKNKSKYDNPEEYKRLSKN